MDPFLMEEKDLFCLPSRIQAAEGIQDEILYVNVWGKEAFYQLGTDRLVDKIQSFHAALKK